MRESVPLAVLWLSRTTCSVKQLWSDANSRRPLIPRRRSSTTPTAFAKPRAPSIWLQDRVWASAENQLMGEGGSRHEFNTSKVCARSYPTTANAVQQCSAIDQLCSTTNANLINKPYWRGAQSPQVHILYELAVLAALYSQVATEHVTIEDNIIVFRPGKP